MVEFVREFGYKIFLGLVVLIFALVICTVGIFGVIVAIPMFIYWGGLFEYNRGRTKTACCWWIVALTILLYISHDIAEYFFLNTYEIYMGTVEISLIIIYVSYIQYKYFKLYDLENKYEALKKDYETLLKEKGR